MAQHNLFSFYVKMYSSLKVLAKKEKKTNKWKYIQEQSRAEAAERKSTFTVCPAVTPLFILRSLLAYNATCTITKDTKREAI